MELIRNSNENEMILEFLKGEINSKRFSNKLYNILKTLNISSDIITNGDISNDNENKIRHNIMKEYRGYPNNRMFKNFPNIYKWNFVKLSESDINNIYYINYDYWNLLSNNTSKSIDSAKNIKNGVEIFDVSNKQYFEGLEYLKDNKFPPIILITCNDLKYLIIEGHYRMTVYGLDKSKINDTYAYIGYCTNEDMKKYDSRMIKE